ncbi:MAG TPA: glycosyltransferase [Limnobacter sp.]|nr:glycosyltransferase [Limnobacter sp.]
MQTSINLFIGWDSRERAAFHALVESVVTNTKTPVNIRPICLHQIESIYHRPISAQSTEFTYSRFLVPYLSGYTGQSIFVDCDFIFTQDIGELLTYIQPHQAVAVVKHNYESNCAVKFNGQEQVNYPKKNWSSLMVFNNSLCTALTPALVETESGKYLHRFEWLPNEELIGEIPADWNFLVGEYAPAVEALPRGIHYTLGGPWFKQFEQCDYNDQFAQYARLANSAIEKKL